MSRKKAEILMDDEEMDVFGFMLQAIGYEYTSTDVKFGKNLIDRENVEKNFHVLEKMVENRSFRRVPYFAIGYLIMITGAHMPEALRQEILEAARWEHEEGQWLDAEFALKRKICLQDFRDKISLYKSGQKFFPSSISYSAIREIDNTIYKPEQLQEIFDSKDMYKVKHINLDGWGLKIIPGVIYECGNLKTLSLEHNQISELPEKIGTFKLLQRLYLNDNELTKLPDSVNDLVSLKALSVTNNPISSLPKTLKNLKNLEHVYVRGTQITKKPEIFKDARFDDYTGTIYLKDF